MTAPVTLYLAAGDAGDGPANDLVVWQQPRLVAPGRPDLLLRDVRGFIARAVGSPRAHAGLDRQVADGRRRGEPRRPVELDRAELARKHDVDAETLSAWLDYLGIGTTAAATLDHMNQPIENVSGYDFVQGWGTPETPSLMANSSDQHVRIPGNMKPHGVVVHPVAHAAGGRRLAKPAGRVAAHRGARDARASRVRQRRDLVARTAARQHAAAAGRRHRARRERRSTSARFRTSPCSRAIWSRC